jgi:hypothetical protein
MKQLNSSADKNDVTCAKIYLPLFIPANYARLPAVKMRISESVF